MTDSLPDIPGADGPPTRLSLGAKFVLFLSLMLSAGALAAGAVFYLQGAQFQDGAEQRNLMLGDIADLKAQMADLETQKLELAARIDEKAVQIQNLGNTTTDATVSLETQMQRRLSSLRSEMSSQVQKLKQNASQVAVQVELLEVRFLLRAAVLRLRVRNDVNAAEVLVVDALARLQRSDDLMILPLRARLEDDLAVLKQIDPVDPQGILSQLQKIEQRAPATLFSLTLVDDDSETAAVASLWQQLLDALSELIRVRKLDLKDVSDFDARVYLSEVERKLAQAEFAIAMTQARTAVLARDTEGFRLQLQNLHDWHTKYTDADSAATATNLVAIRALSERDLAPAPFDLTEALKLLDQLLDGPI